MPLSRLAKLAVVVGLVAATVPTAALATPDPTPAKPAHPVLSGKAPAKALDAVTRAFALGEDTAARRPMVTDGELTMQLLQLRLGLDELSPEDQQVARAYLARPTDGNEYYGANYSKGARPTNDCVKSPTPGSHVCIHWARKTVDAPNLADDDGDGLPDQVEKTREQMNLVWGRIVESGGYDAPLPDKKGPDDKLDVYLVDLGDKGLYGYCGSEGVGKGRSATAYCVLDDDYGKNQFPSHTPLGNLQVTAAHEFFHAVQFAYDVREDAWLMESTATWVEDEIFDDVDDNRFYLPASVLAAPEKPLDTTGGSFLYGNWIWWRYLTERFPQEGGTALPLLVRDVWEAADNSDNDGTFSMKALAEVLRDEGQALSRVYADFGSTNRAPADFYEEGTEYRKSPLSNRFDFTGSRTSADPKVPLLRHMSSTTVAFVPKAGYVDAGWTLRVDVDLPNSGHEPSAQLVVIRKEGPPQQQYIGLSSDGTGTADVAFSSTIVKRVELTLTNGDHAFDCNEGTRWACRGVPDKPRPFDYEATALP